MDKLRKNISIPHILVICSLIIHTVSAATDTLNTSQTIRDGEKLVSSGGMFELGFFSPENSENRYVGIWYKNIRPTTAIWVANRESPLRNLSGVLKVIEPGLLVILNDSNGIIIWSSNRSTSSLRNPVAKLLDSGNLVVKDANNDDFIWQSFDYPTDTLIPGMSLGWNFVSGVESYSSSWKSSVDPAPGNFTLHLDPTGYPQMFLKKGNILQSRLGPWNGLQFSGARNQNENPVYNLTVTINKNEVKYRVDIGNGSVVSRSTVSQNGIVQRWSWNEQTQGWNVYVNLPGDHCDTYGLCGPYGSCHIGNSSLCQCLDYRFVPKDSEAWFRGDWSSGCVRRTNLSRGGDEFLKYSGIKLPDARFSRFNQSMTLGECGIECLRDFSCVAYTQLDIRRGGSGCLFYSGELVDIRETSPGGGQDIYIRMASSELGEKVAESKGNKGVILIASITSAMGMVLLCLILLYVWKRKKDQNMRKGLYGESHDKDSQLPFFKLSTILKATDQFSDKNKLGEGGFGPVYKGLLENGEEIAVKRLSKTSGQGFEEMKNEVILIANLQHRNLVRLLGCCIQGEENMLVYECVPNKSLDLILFDQTKSKLLDWPKRFNIINGIAKGLMYLHEDSRLRIIHRDLKASNILLDSEMNPKISDFGLARSFGGNETEAKTGRVMGTYGYMSPEYTMDGLFSIKSDVFSFGVLVLEIVSGQRNRGFSLNDSDLNLLGYAWTLYKEESSMKLVDPSLGDSVDKFEVLRAIHVGLLCVQKCPEDRPSMSSVVFMLGNDVSLTQAKQPGFFTGRGVSAAHNSTRTNRPNTPNSVNDVTITGLGGR